MSIYLLESALSPPPHAFTLLKNLFFTHFLIHNSKNNKSNILTLQVLCMQNYHYRLSWWYVFRVLVFLAVFITFFTKSSHE